jgi:hypothetical protein
MHRSFAAKKVRTRKAAPVSVVLTPSQQLASEQLEVIDAHARELEKMIAAADRKVGTRAPAVVTQSLERAIAEQQKLVFQALGIVQCAVSACRAHLDEFEGPDVPDIPMAFDAAIALLQKVAVGLDSTELRLREVQMRLKPAKVLS